MSDLERQLLALVMTALRETSPQSAPAFDPERDLPRLQQHLRMGLEAAGLDPNPATPAKPAVLQVPGTPSHLSLVEQDAWLLGWYAGYTAAWKKPAIVLTDTES